jgi:hypothetical protein
LPEDGQRTLHHETWIHDNIISISILAKLSKDYWNVVNNLIMNESNLTPSCTLQNLQELVFMKETQNFTSGSSSKVPDQSKTKDEGISAFKTGSKSKSKRPKPANPCEPGKHNPLAYHPGWRCSKLSKEERKALKPKDPKTHHLDATVQPVVKTLDDINNDLVEYAKVAAYLAGSSTVGLTPILDSGASHNMVNDVSAFCKVKNNNINIFTGGLEQRIVATAVGETFIWDDNSVIFQLNNVLCVTNLH